MGGPFVLLMVAGYAAAAVLALLGHLETALFLFFGASLAGVLASRLRP